jgi:maleamate amidohydrolase
VVRDAVGDRAAGPREANRYNMSAKYADVVSKAEAIAALPGLRA